MAESLRHANSALAAHESDGYAGKLRCSAAAPTVLSMFTQVVLLHLCTPGSNIALCSSLMHLCSNIQGCVPYMVTPLRCSSSATHPSCGLFGAFHCACSPLVMFSAQQRHLTQLSASSGTPMRHAKAQLPLYFSQRHSRLNHILRSQRAPCINLAPAELPLGCTMPLIVQLFQRDHQARILDAAAQLPLASRLVASCSSSTSTLFAGS